MRRLTFDISGRRRAQPFDCPLDGRVSALDGLPPIVRFERYLAPALQSAARPSVFALARRTRRPDIQYSERFARLARAFGSGAAEAGVESEPLMSRRASGFAEAGEEPLASEDDRTTSLAEAGNAQV